MEKLCLSDVRGREWGEKWWRSGGSDRLLAEQRGVKGAEGRLGKLRLIFPLLTPANEGRGVFEQPRIPLLSRLTTNSSKGETVYSQNNLLK